MTKYEISPKKPCSERQCIPCAQTGIHDDAECCVSLRLQQRP